MCLEGLIIFENQSHRTKAGKNLHTFDIYGYFYTRIVTK